MLCTERPPPCCETDSMQPQPDPRWANIAGGLGDDGRIRPMSFAVLAGLAAQWAELLPTVPAGQDGPASLLRTARSLFTYAWFDRVLYPEAPRTPFRKLVRRAQREGILPANIAERADAGAELRNRFSHPATQATFTVGMAAPMLENTHRLVALVMTAASRASEPQVGVETDRNEDEAKGPAPAVDGDGYGG